MDRIKGENSDRKPVVAALAASALMLTFGLVYRPLAAQLSSPVSRTPLNPAALQDFPMQIGDWTGEDVPLDEAEAILDQIRAEASINRRYSHCNGSESISLFIAASGVTGGTLVGHPPEICNVSNGHVLTDQRSAELPLDNGMRLPCRILQFSRDVQLDREKKTVLYYYMADGQRCGNRSELRSRVRRGSSMVSCIAQVQIVASATRIVSEFAVDSASSIAGLFEHIEKDWNRDSHHEVQDGEQ